MKFALLVKGAGRATSPGPSTALAFARAALAEGHQIVQIFFHAEGVHQANRLQAPPPDETNAAAEWSRFAAESGVELVLCSSAGLRRGVREANLAAGFHISGVGQWLEAALAADRVMVFGA
jgi:tRNA 2-thiouridine synthesizing protein D